MIFETHAHYDDEAFGEDREELIGQLQEKGITRVINIGASMKSSQATMEFIDKYPFFYGAVGVHPMETTDLQESDMEQLKRWCQHDKVLAIGEIGLDYYWNEPDAEHQKKWFIRQMELAREVKLPIVIHSRDAAKDTLDLMKEYHAETVGGVVHCYSYSVEMAKEFLKLGFYIGIGGVITFNNAKKIREVVEYLPMDRILLETDSPYLAPVPYRGKRNNSLNLPLVAEKIAQIKGIAYDEVLECTRKNGETLFFHK